MNVFMNWEKATHKSTGCVKNSVQLKLLMFGVTVKPQIGGTCQNVLDEKNDKS